MKLPVLVTRCQDFCFRPADKRLPARRPRRHPEPPRISAFQGAGLTPPSLVTRGPEPKWLARGDTLRDILAHYCSTHTHTAARRLSDGAAKLLPTAAPWRLRGGLQAPHKLRAPELHPAVGAALSHLRRKLRLVLHNADRRGGGDPIEELMLHCL